MIFTKMRLKNFRQYNDEQFISFAYGSHKNVTIVNGANGAGKTSLFSAINWCLYNEGVEGIGALVSKESALKKDFGDVVDCEVRIWFEHQGTKYVAIRKAREKKVPLKDSLEGPGEGEKKYKSFSLKPLPHEEEDFVLLREIDGNMDQVSDPNRLIDSVLPKNARQYFLFDGEKIEQLTRPDHDVEIREAIRNILQLPSIENSIQHLGVVIKEYTKEGKKAASGDEEKLYAKIEKYENKIDKIASKISEEEKKHKDTRNLKEKIEEDLRKLDAIKHLIKSRDDLGRQYDEAVKNRNKWKLSLRNSLSSSYTVVAKNIVQQKIKDLKHKKENGLIPAPVQDSFIEELLTLDKCICGNQIHEGSEGREKIKEYFERSKKYNQTAQSLSDLLGDLEIIESKSEGISKRIQEAMREVSIANQNIDLISKKLEDLHLEIKGHAEEDISKLEKQRKSLEEEEDNIKAEIAKLKNDRVLCKRVIKLTEDEIEKISKKKKAAKKFIETRKLSEKALDVLQDVYEKFACEKRSEIEEEVKKVFDMLIWKDTMFPYVRVSDEYKLYVYDHYGSPAREELSAGERQVLSLSFIAAMAKVSGGNVPLVMDTPFGRLFSKHRENIVEQIPKMTQQLILMVQDEELKDKAKEIIMERVGAEYNLEFENGCTAIEEV